MASKTSPETEPPQSEPVIDMAELGARLIRRRAELGAAGEMPRNAGINRTPAKRALLAEIAKTGAKW